MEKGRMRQMNSMHAHNLLPAACSDETGNMIAVMSMVISVVVHN